MNLSIKSDNVFLNVSLFYGYQKLGFKNVRKPYHAVGNDRNITFENMLRNEVFIKKLKFLFCFLNVIIFMIS